MKIKQLVLFLLILKDEQFDNVGDFYLRNEKNEDIILDKIKVQQYFLKLHKINSDFLNMYFNDINQNYGIKFYYLEEETLNTEEKILKLDIISENNDYEIIDFEDELFYSYLIWSLRSFLIPYDNGLYQDKNKLLLNLASYKQYQNNGIYIQEKNKLNYDHISIFFSNISPLEYAVGYFKKKKKFI